MLFRLPLLAVLAGVPRLGTAQTAPSAAPFYVGLGAAVLTDAPFQQYNSPALYGPALTGGVAFGPRWALQIGAHLGWRHENETYVSAGPSPTVYASSYRTRYLTVPLLARYTFTAPARRVHVDALAGVTLVHSSVHGTNTTHFPNGQTEESRNDDYAAHAYSVSLGPAARYALTPRVALTANAVVNADLRSGYSGGTFSDRLFLNALVGAHYTFGSR